MRNNYQRTRFALFAHSYSGQIIAKRLRSKYHLDDAKKSREVVRIHEITRMVMVLRLNQKLLRQFILFAKYPSCTTTKLGNKVDIFLQIEKEMLTLIAGKQDKESTTQEDYERALLEPAIERVAGNHLSDIENDELFDTQLKELQTKYRHWYYLVAYKYKLPTARIIPFVLRLISP